MVTIYDKTVSFVAGCAGGIVGFLFGDVSSVLLTLIAFCCIDFASGIISAYMNKTLNSHKCFEGIYRKVMIFCMVAIAHMLDRVLGLTVLMCAVEFFYIANEGISITENAGKIGLPIPGKIKRALEQLREDGEDET